MSTRQTLTPIRTELLRLISTLSYEGVKLTKVTIDDQPTGPMLHDLTDAVPGASLYCFGNGVPIPVLVACIESLTDDELPKPWKQQRPDVYAELRFLRDAGLVHVSSVVNPLPWCGAFVNPLHAANTVEANVRRFAGPAGPGVFSTPVWELSNGIKVPVSDRMDCVTLTTSGIDAITAKPRAVSRGRKRTTKHAADNPARLTDNQRKICDLKGEGLTYAQIAKKLNKKHKQSIERSHKAALKKLEKVKAHVRSANTRKAESLHENTQPKKP